MLKANRNRIDPSMICAEYFIPEFHSETIVNQIQNSYWGNNLSKDQVLNSISNSYCVTLEMDGLFLGFARAISDLYVSAHLKDVIVTPTMRRRDVGTHLINSLFRHPKLQEVKLWHTGTRDAEQFYESLGFMTNPSAKFLYMDTT